MSSRSRSWGWDRDWRQHRRLQSLERRGVPADRDRRSCIGGTCDACLSKRHRELVAIRRLPAPARRGAQCAARSVASRGCVDQHDTRYRRRRDRKPAVRERRLPVRIEQSDVPRAASDGGRRCAGRSAGCRGELCVVVTQAGPGDHHHRPADLVEWHAVHCRGRQPAWLQRYGGHTAGGLGTARELSHRVRRPAARPAFIDDRGHHRPSHERLPECPRPKRSSALSP